MKARLYYEAHITIDPVAEGCREFVQERLLGPWGFRLAKLLMDKGVPSTLDTFCTAHGTDYVNVQLRVVGAVRALQREGYTVRRYKVEDTMMDSRTADVLDLLQGASDGA